MTDLAPFDLQGTAAVVTGGGSGIGRAIAVEFARRGAQVLVTDVDDARAETVAGEITAEGGAATWQHLDVNLLGIVRSNEVFLPVLMEQGHGHVVNTASTNGIIVYSYDRTPYAASKAAVMMLSQQLFVYLRPYGVGVSCLCPAGVLTNIIEHMRPVGEQLPLRSPHLPLVEAHVAGTNVANAVESRAFLVLTAEEVRDELRRKGDDLDAYLLERERWLHDEADA
jgi:NAD(P)-dependent dehydrogenase (short-subunit alcohol dehydrogenase family)